MDLAPPLEPLDMWTMTAGATYPSHRHQGMELVYHRNGSGYTVLDDGTRLRFGPGSVTHLPAGIAHAQNDQAGSTVVCLLARWRVRVPATMRQPWASAPGSDVWLDREFTWLGSAAWKRNPACRIEAGFRLAAVLAHLAAEVLSGPEPLLRAPGARVLDAQRWIRAHLRQATVSGTANAVGVSSDHLTRLFSAACNYGPRHAIAQARVDRAKELLSVTNHSLQDIATNVGFGSARHFCHAFRRVTGVTPGRFRELDSGHMESRCKPARRGGCKPTG